MEARHWYAESWAAVSRWKTELWWSEENGPDMTSLTFHQGFPLRHELSSGTTLTKWTSALISRKILPLSRLKGIAIILCLHHISYMPSTTLISCCVIFETQTGWQAWFIRNHSTRRWSHWVCLWAVEGLVESTWLWTTSRSAIRAKFSAVTAIPSRLSFVKAASMSSALWLSYHALVNVSKL